MTVYAIGATSLIGGADGALDAELADDIGDGDPGFVFVKGGKVYFYIADATSGAAESSPDVIAPDEDTAGVPYTGDLRWILTATYGVVDVSGTPVDNDFAKFTDADTIEGRSYAEVKQDLNLEIGTDVLAQQTIGIANDNLLEVDGSPNTAEYARFTINGLEGRAEAEFKEDFNLEIGVDVLAQQTIGIANDNLLEVDDATAAANEFARFTLTGLEGRSYAEVREDLDLEIGIDVLAQQTIGIADNNLLEVDDVAAADNEYARFTAFGLEGRNEAEFKGDFNLEIGTDVLAQQTIGIANDNLLEVDGSPASTEYARFTTNGLEGRTESEFKADFNLEIGTDVQAYDANNALTTTKLDDFATPDDNTDLDATTVQHGLLPKLGGGAANFLRADGTWAVPPGGGLSWALVAVDTAATNGYGYMVNASGGNITVTAPAAPTEGHTIGICDVYNMAETNVVKVARNGSNIEGAAEDLTVDIAGSGFLLAYADATRGWEIVSEIGNSSEILSEGALTEMLVGGGAGASPVWTTATGSGSPVRATSPSLTSPTITDPVWGADSGPNQVNLLTNSGFGCFSNSEDLYTTAGTVPAIGDGYSEYEDNDGSTFASWTSATATITDAGANLLITQTAGATQSIYYILTGLTIGKLYEVTVILADGTGAWGAAADALRVWDSPVTANLGTTAITGPGTFSLVWECSVATSNRVYFYPTLGAGETLNITSIMVHEVTPGIVSAAATGPDGWYRQNSTLDIWREHSSTYTKVGSTYSLKTKKGTDTSERLWWSTAAVNGAENHYKRFAGRTVTLGAWVYSVSATDNVKLAFYDSVGGYQYETSFAGADAWEWHEFTISIDSSTDNFRAGFLLDGDTNDIAYISQPMLVFGSSIGEGNYVQPPGEWVNLEKAIPIIENGSPASIDDKILNLESLSDGKMPKGIKAIDLTTIVTNSSITSGEGIIYSTTSTFVFGDLRLMPLVNSIRADAKGVVACDSNGDIYQTVNESGETLSGHYLSCNRVQVSP